MLSGCMDCVSTGQWFCGNQSDIPNIRGGVDTDDKGAYREVSPRPRTSNSSYNP